MAPILDFKWNFNLAMYFLDRFLISIPTKACAKNGMPFDNALPRPNERGGIDSFVQSTNNLTDIDALLHGIETVK